MTEYIVTDPKTGRKVKLRGDSPPTDDELEQIFANLPPQAEPEREVTGSNRFFSGEMAQDAMNVPDELRPEIRSRAGLGQRMAGGEAARLAAGAAEPVVGAAQIAAMGVDAIRRRLGQDSNFGRAIGSQWSRLRQFQNEGRTDPDAFDGARLAGNIAMGAGAVSRIPQAAGVLGRIGQGSAIGAALSATQPALSDRPESETMTQALTGLAVGAAVPAVGAGLRMGYDRFAPGGVERSAARLANNLSGSRQQRVVEELRRVAPDRQVSAQQPRATWGQQQAASIGPPRPRDLAPGVRPNITAGEAAAPAGSAEFSALQRAALSRQDPSVGLGIDRAASRMREAQLQSIGGTRESLAAAQASVDGQVGAMYRAAYAEPFSITTALSRMLKNPFVRDAERMARKSANSDGVRRGTTEYMHYVKKAMDGIIDASPVEGGLRPIQRRAATAARSRFLDALDDANPAYAQARSRAADLYRPLDQMRVAQNLEQRLTAPIVDQGAGTAGQRSASFAQGLRDAPATLKRATGFRGQQSMDDVMTPDQMQVISRVGRDLSNRADFDELATAGAAKVNATIGSMYSKQIAPMLNRYMMIANNILKRTAAGASERGMKVLAEKMQDPAAMARIMEAATLAEKTQLNALMNSIMSQGAGRSVTQGFELADDLEQWFSEEQ